MDSQVHPSEESKTIIVPPFKATPKKLFNKKLQGFVDQDLKQDYKALQSEWAQLGQAQMTLQNVQQYRDGCAMVYEPHKSQPKFKAAIQACHQQSFTLPKKYGNDAPVRVLVHRPLSLPAKNNAAIIFAHGGGAIGGDPEQNIPIASFMACQGQLVVFNIQYRLAPEAKYFQMISDMYVVVRHVYQNAEQLGINPKQIAIQGQSGGGYLCMGTAAMLAVKNQSGMAKLMIVGQPISNSFYLTEKVQNMTKIQATAMYDGPFVPKHIATDLDKQLKERDPILFPGIANDQVMVKYPPAFIFESEYDNFLEPTRRFAERMEKLGRLNEYVVYPGVHHGFYGQFKYKRTTEYWDDYKKVINQYLKC